MDFAHWLPQSRYYYMCAVMPKPDQRVTVGTALFFLCWFGLFSFIYLTFFLGFNFFLLRCVWGKNPGDDIARKCSNLSTTSKHCCYINQVWSLGLELKCKPCTHQPTNKPTEGSLRPTHSPKIPNDNMPTITKHGPANQISYSPLR